MPCMFYVLSKMLLPLDTRLPIPMPSRGKLIITRNHSLITVRLEPERQYPRESSTERGILCCRGGFLYYLSIVSGSFTDPLSEGIARNQGDGLKHGYMYILAWCQHGRSTFRKAVFQRPTIFDLGLFLI